MTTTNRLTHFLVTMACAIIGSFTISAGAEETQPPGMLETWTCSYLPGKAEKDVMAARDYYVRQAAKAGVDIGPAFMWSLVKGDIAFDLIWHAPHENLAAYAASADEQAAADELSDVTARFYSAADCTPRLGIVRNVFERAERGDGTKVITSFACGLRGGVSPADIADLEGHAARVFDSMGENAPDSSLSITPTTGGPTSPDYVIFNVFDSMTAWSDFVTELLGSADGQQLGRHLANVAECTQAIWTSQRVIDPPAG